MNLLDFMLEYQTSVIDIVNKYINLGFSFRYVIMRNSVVTCV